MRKYCLGFVFNAPADRVLLIQKHRPDLYNGTINGLGGELDPKEDYHTTMIRKMQEESGLTIPKSMWHVFCRIDGPIDNPYVLICFNARISDNIFETAHQHSIDGVKAYPINHLPWAEMVPDLNWLLPLAFQSLINRVNAFVRFSDENDGFTTKMSIRNS